MAARDKQDGAKKAIRAKRQAAAARAMKPRAAKGAKAAVPDRGAKGSTAAGKGKKARQLALVEEEIEWVCGFDFEIAARGEGARLVAGVDEVGRGPLFGPVVAAAVILPAQAEIAGLEGLNDSKKLCEEDRERFDGVVRRVAVAWAIAEVDVETIDRINILQASRLAMRLAVEALGLRPDCLLIDGNQKIDYCPPDAVCRQKTIVQGDGRSKSIAAASVIAKVHRDRLLLQLDERYPGYGLATNKGYATPEHRRAILSLGITEMHRRSFRPVALAAGIDVEFDLLDAAGDVLDEDWNADALAID